MDLMEQWAVMTRGEDGGGKEASSAAGKENVGDERGTYFSENGQSKKIQEVLL